MDNRGKLAEAASVAGVTVEKLVTDAIIKEGSIAKAARTLDVNDNALRYHLRKHGIRVRTQSANTATLEKQPA